MKIKWVNHASYILEHKNIKLITDPWLFGSAFDGSWDLLIESKFTISDFQNITHIWFSHEHSDHFTPWVLSKIPEEVRKKITVLFHETLDKRVLNFCKNLSFKTIELENKKKYILADDFSIICGRMLSIDSWLFCEVNGLSILNLNDCVVKNYELSRPIKKITGDVDILLTQFSYANWVGNPEEKFFREGFALACLNRLKLQIEIFNPTYTIPFASFIYFSHEENKYLNDSVNTIEGTCEFITDNTDSKPIVLYPGDWWDCVSKYSNQTSLAKYKNIYVNIADKIYKKSLTPLVNDELIIEANKYLQNIKNKNSVLAMNLLRLLPSYRNIVIKFMDTDKYCTFDWHNGIYFFSNLDNKQYDVELSTNSLKYIFQFEWGFSTVSINGRYRMPCKKNRKFNNIFIFGLLNSEGKRLSVRTLLNMFLSKVLGKHITLIIRTLKGM